MAYTAAPSATPVVRRKPGAANPTEAPPFGEGAMYRTSVPLIYKMGGTSVWLLMRGGLKRGAKEYQRDVPSKGDVHHPWSDGRHALRRRGRIRWAHKMGG